MAKTRKKLILAAAVAAGLLVLAIAAVLFTEFDSPELGRLALGQVGEASGFDLQAKGFRLNLLRGLELEEVEARATDGGMTASVEKVVLKHRPADLLGGTLTVTEILIESPRVVLEDGGESRTGESESEPAPATAEPGAGDEAAGEAEATSLDLAISTIRLTGGSLMERAASGETTEVRGLEVEIHDLKLGSDRAAGGRPAAEQTAGGQAAGRGEIRVAEIELSDGVETTTIRGVEVDLDELALDRGLSLEGTSLSGEALFSEVVTSAEQETVTQAKDVRGRLELKDGGLQLRELELWTPQGILQGDFTADVAADPLTYSLNLQGDALSTAVLLGLGDVRGLGTSTFELAASGEGSELAQVAGEGRLTVGGGELPDHPVLAQVEQLLGNVVLIGAGYEEFPVTFDIRKHRIHLAPCELRAGGVSLTMSGWVDFDGPLEMELSVLAPPEGLKIKEIPAEVLEVLAEADGRINLPMLVTGTADGSAVKLNQAYLEHLGKRYVRKRVESELGKALSGLFGDN